MTQDDFMKLFRYMEEMREEMRSQFEQKADKADIERILNILDGIAERLDIDDTERVAAMAQLERHENWIKQAGKKLNLKYDASAGA